MTFVESIKRNLTTKAFCTVQGRATRSEYWWFYLFTVLVSLELGLISFIGQVIGLILLVPSICVAVRRLHDTNHSGWLLLLPFAAIIVGAILFAIMQNAFGGMLLALLVLGSYIYIFVLTLMPSKEPVADATDFVSQAENK